MSKVKVSIIVPVYNQEKRIKGCLESLKNLAFHDAEFLIINDGSVDKTEEVIGEFINKSQDSRFKLLSKNNEGPGAARNYGIERARGEYIWFIDGDDRIEESSFLEDAINFMKNNNLELLEFNFKAQKKDAFLNSPIQNTSKIVPGIELFSSEMKMTSAFWLTVWHFIVRRSFILENEFRFLKSSYAEDTLWSLKLISKAARTAFFDRVGYYYLYYPDTISHNLSNLRKSSKDTVEAVIDIINYLKKEKLDDKVESLREFIAKLYVGAVVQLTAIDNNFELDKKQLRNICKDVKLKRNDFIKKQLLLYTPYFVRKKICRLIVRKFLNIDKEEIK